MAVRSTRRFRPFLLLAALGFVACGQHSQTIAPPAVSTLTSSGQANADGTSSASSAPPVTPPPADPPHIAAVRLERWKEAATLLDGMDPAEKAKPEIRFLRARV